MFVSFGLSCAAFAKPPRTRSWSGFPELFGALAPLLLLLLVGSTLSNALLVAAAAALLALFCAVFLTVFKMFFKSCACTAPFYDIPFFHLMQQVY
jgi:hypothetical protein